MYGALAFFRKRREKRLPSRNRAIFSFPRFFLGYNPQIFIKSVEMTFRHALNACRLLRQAFNALKNDRFSSR